MRGLHRLYFCENQRVRLQLRLHIAGGKEQEQAGQDEEGHEERKDYHDRHKYAEGGERWHRGKSYDGEAHRRGQGSAKEGETGGPGGLTQGSFLIQASSKLLTETLGKVDGELGYNAGFSKSVYRM